MLQFSFLVQDIKALAKKATLVKSIISPSESKVERSAKNVSKKFNLVEASACSTPGPLAIAIKKLKSGENCTPREMPAINSVLAL